MKPSPLLALLCLLAASCAGPLNFTDTRGPRYAGCCVPAVTDPDPDSLRLVTFNIQYSLAIDDAIALFHRERALRKADVVLLQEMDVAGTRRIAHALGMNYVYYPAVIHPINGRPFGNAILARWPIEQDRKLLLPFPGRFARTRRIAVAGTIRVGGRSVRLYSVHLGTGVETPPERRRAQAMAITADADTAGTDAVIIGGDVNSERVGRVFDGEGYAWVTRALPATASVLSLDHFFVRGVALTRPDARGVISDNAGASDHKPLWVTVALRGR